MVTEVTDDDIERFTCGSCYQLAEVINEATGWPICAFWDTGYKDYDIHAFVRMPNGRYLDVLGDHTAREMKERWDARDMAIRKIRLSYSFRSWNVFNPFYDSSERAREILPALIPPGLVLAS